MKYSNRLISTLLIGGGLLNLVAPVLALGTAANQDISNTATATYEDPSGAISNTTSNTVVVKVAEVAGITITAGAVTNTTTAGASPVAGDALTFDFDLTNIGNDTTDFHVPNQAQVGSSPVTVQKVQYLDGTTWKDVSGLTNGLISKTAAGGDIIPGAVVKVRVLATVNAGTTTGAINVTLGNTGQTNLQNDAFSATGGDVYTVDKSDTFGGLEVAGVPSNGVREAAATATTVVNPGKQAFVKVTKVAGAVDDNGTDKNITDDKVTYTLGLEVAGTAPTGTNLVAEDLAGTNINLDGAVVPRILVSDAIPAGATLNATTLPTAPTGWTVVYTTAAIGSATANNAAWTVTAPATLSSVTRVGYIFTGTIVKGSAAVTGFQLTLNLNLPATGGSVLNIAQAFGTTAVNGAPDPTKPAVDESGDNQFNNLNPDGTPGPTPTNGVATGADGVDVANNSTGTGPGGEASIVTVAPVKAPGAIPILNGPENKPAATGPSGQNNDDFTNKSVTIDTNQAKWDPLTGKPNTVDPQSTGFTNSISQATSATRPQFVALLPTTPANKTDLPTGTTVKIIANGVSVTYTYDNVTGVFTPTVPGATPITLTVPTTGNVDYGVEIDLPAGTAQMTGFPVAITSFAAGAPAVVDASTGATTLLAVPSINTIDPITQNVIINPLAAQNVTIDRLYTGYLKMAKEAQVYKIEGGVTTIVSPFSSTAPKAEPGQFIEYRIKYSNISEAASATSGSVVMDAKNIKIVENGTSGSNNWATTLPGATTTLTEHKPQTAQDNNGVIVYDAGAKTNGDLVIGEYIDSVPTLAPGVSGTFTFTRQVK
jgi:hypothetical protein